MQGVDNLAGAESRLMRRAGSLECCGCQAQTERQERAGDAHAQGILARRLFRQIGVRTAPVPALRTAACDHLMLNHVNWR